jgi:rhodanese-related sulfurtransferase
VRTADEQAAIEIEPGQLVAQLAGDHCPQMIDVREAYERQAGHIEGSRHVPLIELTGTAPTISQDRPVVFYCRVGSRSLMAAQAFRAAGFDAYTLAGGLLRWAQEGRPLSPRDGHVADH